MERLDTTNAVLIVLALASVVQTLVVVGIAIGALRAYRAATALLDTKVTPALIRFEGVLTNLERTSAVVRTRADDMSRALDSARHTASHLGAVMWPRAAVVAGVTGGVLSAIKRWRAARRTQPDVTVVSG